MAEEQQTAQIRAAFPAPPPFYQHFTVQNLERLTHIREASGVESSEANASSGAQGAVQPRLLDLPPELRYLVAPPPPANGKYRSFGAFYDINEVVRSLKEQNIEQLYPSPPTSPAARPGSTREVGTEWTLDRAVYLKKMAKSILLNFLELVGMLSVDPSQYAQKTSDLTTLFINCHHLINEYRPHQARETLIMMMEEQLARKRKEIEDIKVMKAKVEALLDGSGKSGVERIPTTEEDVRLLEADADEGRKDVQRAMWQALESEMGT